jgi:hypothetical protein
MPGHGRPWILAARSIPTVFNGHRIADGRLGDLVRTMLTAVAAAIIVASTVPLPAQSRVSMFVFRNNFWLNLHQFLRGEVYRRGARLPPGLDPVSLSVPDRATWTRAVDAYVDVASHDILFDELSVRIHNRLTGVGDAVQLADGLVDSAVTNALNAAAPIYRARVWPARQAANDAWIVTARALLSAHETMMASTLASLYRTQWPVDPVLVDVVGEVGPNSAITHAGPAGYGAHTQASAGSTRNGGDAPLELLFHEAAHGGIDRRLQELVAEEGARQGLAPPDDLWHSIMMFTTGFVATRELGKAGRAYESYESRYKQIKPTERSAFERDWQPYLEGTTSFAHALHDLVRDAR